MRCAAHTKYIPSGCSHIHTQATHLLVACCLLLLLGCELVRCQQQDYSTANERPMNEAEAAEARHTDAACRCSSRAQHISHTPGSRGALWAGVEGTAPTRHCCWARFAAALAAQESARSGMHSRRFQSLRCCWLHQTPSCHHRCGVHPAVAAARVTTLALPLHGCAAGFTPMKKHGNDKKESGAVDAAAGRMHKHTHQIAACVWCPPGL